MQTLRWVHSNGRPFTIVGDYTIMQSVDVEDMYDVYRAWDGDEVLVARTVTLGDGLTIANADSPALLIKRDDVYDVYGDVDGEMILVRRGATFDDAIATVAEYR
jgi:hypothetical protein